MKITLSNEQRAAFAHDRHLAVVANAGAGKTSVLSLRVIWLVVEHGVPLDRIVAITFTTKAAAEMRERIRAYLTVLLSDAEQRSVMQFTVSEAVVLDRLRRARADMGKARISTFHSFCSGLLRQYGHVLNINPESTELTSRESRSLRSQAVRESIREFHEAEPSSMQWLYEQIDFSRLETVVRSLVASPERLRIVRGRASESASDVERTEDLRQRARRVLMEVPSHLVMHLQAALQATYPDRSSVSVEAFRTHVQHLVSRLTSRDQIEHSLFGEARTLLRTVYNENGTLKQKIASDQVDLRITQPLPEKEMKLLRVLANDFEVQDDHTTLNVAELATRIAVRAADLYDAYKRRRQAIDFDDMMTGVVDFLTHHPQISGTIASSIDYLMVDEYQDTNPTQYQLVQLLIPSLAEDASHRGRLFIVGDTKQSIYRFRDADVRLFTDTVTAMEAANQRAGINTAANPTTILLDTSYRMAAPLAHRMNALCAEVFCVDSPFDVPYTQLKSGRITSPDQAVGTLTSLITDYDPTDTESVADSESDVDGSALDREARSVVAYVSRMLAEGRIRQPGDIGILARRTVMVTAVARLLHEVQIPFEVYGGRSFFSRPEVADLRNLLTAATVPSDAAARYAVLRSPIFGCTDADLFMPTVHRSMEGASEAVQQAMAIITELGIQVTVQPVELAIRSALRASGWYRTLASDPRREQILANVEKALTIINEASLRPGATMYDVLEELAPPSGRDDEAEQSFSVDPDVVKVMTIHASKGLEFGVAVLCDLGSKTNPQDYHISDLFGVTLPRSHDAGLITIAQKRLEQQRAVAEDRRLFYVAITRAKDHAVISLNRRYNKADSKTGVRPLSAAYGIGALLQPILLGDLGHRYSDAEIIATPEMATYVGLIRQPMVIHLHQPVKTSHHDHPDHIRASEGPSHESFTSHRSAADGREIGQIVHNALEKLAYVPAPSDDDLVRAVGTPPHAEALQHVQRLIASPTWVELQRLHTADGYTLHVETDFGAMLNNTLVYGRMDAVHLGSRDAIVWDWKTNDCTANTVADVAEHYAGQMRTYSWILLQNPIIEKVTTRLVFTSLIESAPELAVVERVATRDDIPHLMDNDNGRG